MTASSATIKVPRIVLCGGAYSDNLGDAMISDCLAYQLDRYLPRVKIIKLDIAGRNGYNHQHFSQKELALSMIGHSPTFIRPLLVLGGWSIFLKRRLEPIWDGILQPGDRVVIGGGQLFQDDYLNFPLKLSLLARKARQLNCQVAVSSVGVSAKWSRLGHRLFVNVFRQPGLLYCSVRDITSKQHLLRHFPFLSRETIQIALDPVLIAERVYHPDIKSVYKLFDIGISLIHPNTLLLCAPGSTPVNFSTITGKWLAFIAALTKHGLRVALFTNGAREDETYMQSLIEGLDVGQVAVLPRATTPAKLVAYMARMRAVVSYRLHASIVSYALNVPSLGLTWDRKVEAFYNICHRQEWLCDFSTAPLDELVTKTRQLVQTSLDTAQRTSVIERCADGVKRLSDYLKGQQKPITESKVPLR